MTLDQFLFVLIGPLSVLVAALIVLVLARWQDAREDRRQATKKAAAHRH
jgi:hypothetical protein